METTQTEIRIYVACLAAYNNGHLHGAWIDATQDVEQINAEITAMLAASPIEGAEEHGIHDHEGFGGIRINEYDGIERVVILAEFIQKNGALGAALLNYYSDIEEAKTALKDHYGGEYLTVAEFARELTEETGDVPERLAFYIDYDAMARDLLINDVFAIEVTIDETHIFWSH
ncbi:MAG: antirestriction protein ArdA [Paracoccaceae bacterium]